MKRLIIIGAGSFGREILEYAIAIVEAGKNEWEIGGFLDDNLHALDEYDVKYPILGRLQSRMNMTRGLLHLRFLLP